MMLSDSVSVIIPCRNEERFIASCLDSIIANDYPKDRLEVLVVDGMSEDRTRAILEGYTRQYPFIRVLDNPSRITPAALNLGIENAKGEIIVRMDAHSAYPASYISAGIECLSRTNADLVGGPVITRPGGNTLVAAGIALATSHRFGVGNSQFRTSLTEGFVDTVPFGVYRRAVFDRIGLFDERLVRNQDNELNSRIVGSGGRIFLSPRLAAEYFNQATLRGFLRQAWRAGMWNVVTIRINSSAFRWRHFVPFFFVTALLALALSAPFGWWPKVLLLALSVTYFSGAIAAALESALRKGFKGAAILPGLFFLYHVAYGLGTWAGLLKLMAGGWTKAVLGKGD
jgi:glycosyltransferase involved in cell wall biosynthesis